eukprot:7194696-Prymnesium_polylepis.1
MTNPACCGVVVAVCVCASEAALCASPRGPARGAAGARSGPLGREACAADRIMARTAGPTCLSGLVPLNA